MEEGNKSFPRWIFKAQFTKSLRFSSTNFQHGRHIFEKTVKRFQGL